MSEWNPNVYLDFADERTQPSFDLLHRIQVEDPLRVIDLGCGPGNSTAVLRAAWPDAEIVGLDNSARMIEAARDAYPSGNWILADAASWVADEPFDVVFANALLQWLPDHAQVCRHLLRQIRPGGALAVQVPAHYDAAMHIEILDVSRLPAWNDRLHNARTALEHHPPSFYYDALRPVAGHIDIWETTYQHVLPGPEGVLRWFRGTGLRPFLEPLSQEERSEFERLLLDRYIARYQPQADGKVLFPFRRLFFVAYAST